MKRCHLSPLNFGAVVLLFPLLFAFGETEMTEKELVVGGTVVCLDQVGSEASCSEESDLFALKTADGRRFTFRPEDPNSKMFRDERLRKRELQVRAWHSGPGELEIIKVHSVIGDQLHDVHYFCSTCNIKTSVGGLCWCCREEFEFREIPLGQE